MKTFEYNVNKSEPTTILGYLDIDGCFIESIEEAVETESYLVAKIIVNSGLLSCGESFEDYCQRVARIAAKKLGMI